MAEPRWRGGFAATVGSGLKKRENAAVRPQRKYRIRGNIQSKRISIDTDI